MNPTPASFVRSAAPEEAWSFRADSPQGMTQLPRLEHAMRHLPVECELPTTLDPVAVHSAVMTRPATAARSRNLHWQALAVDKRIRAELKGQRPCIVWFTGLSGAGKSTIANLVEQGLAIAGRHTYLLDGDNVRHGLNKDLGFTEADRMENIRRVAEVACLMADAGLVVLVSFISPFRAERRMARGLVEAGEFIEVFVDAPIEVAEARDPKGLYRKARRGELKNFTGVDSPYEPPESPEVRLDTTQLSPERAAAFVLGHLQGSGVFAHR